MSHLRTFVANQVLSRIRAFLGVFCPDFYSDIEDFTQILCRYLSKISAAGTSGKVLFQVFHHVTHSQRIISKNRFHGLVGLEIHLVLGILEPLLK